MDGSHRLYGVFKFVRKLHVFWSGYNILHSCEHFIVLSFPVDILMSVRRYITVVFFKISMKISDIEYSFMY